jgi:hypothetical protein
MSDAAGEARQGRLSPVQVFDLAVKSSQKTSQKGPIWEIWVYYLSQQRSINTIDRALILSFGGPLCKSHLLLQM